MVLRVGWLTRIPLLWAHTDLTLRYCFVGGISHRWLCVWAGSVGLLGARSHGFIFRTHRTHRTDRTYRTNRTDWAVEKIIRESGICVRPPWDWDLCEASVDSVGAGDKITKNCVIWGGVLKDLKKKCGKSCYIKKILQTLCVKYKKWVGQTSLLLLF